MKIKIEVSVDEFKALIQKEPKKVYNREKE